MNRRETLKRFFGGLLCTVGLGSVFQVKRYKVETLEHEGWGYKGEVAGESKYITRWTFSTKEEAEQFVRSLMPRLTKVYMRRDPGMIDQLRSGYRGAVRAQFRNSIERIEAELVSEQPDGTYKVVDLGKRASPFWSVENAWEYLSNMRINGEVVSRTRGNGISQYLIQPFIKGEPEISTWPPEESV